MDLVKILENVPIGTPLYSTAYGDVYYKGIDCNSEYPIMCRDSIDRICCYTKDGKLFIKRGECILFPSKDNRNWNDFIKKQFKPFDKVLVRDNDTEPWRLALFSHIKDTFYYMIYNCGRWKQCIHYEGNEHLLGVVENHDYS